jgi:hypothetical protein
MGLGSLMATRETDLSLPLPPQFLAAWLAVWLGPGARRERLGGLSKFYRREAA